MSSINAITTKMIVKNRSGDLLDISELVAKVTIQGDYQQGARRLDCSYMASSLDNSIPIAEIQEYNNIYFYQHDSSCILYFHSQCLF